MKEMRNILGWLGMQEEASILSEAQEHVKETHNDRVGQVAYTHFDIPFEEALNTDPHH